MRGDFSRKPFRRDLHDAALLHQQGRVWLDGDWNEHAFHRLDLNEQEAFDVIGPCGIPDNPTIAEDDDFYLIEPDPVLGTGDFRIRAGRAYVDGILTVLDADTTYLTQPDLLDPPPISFAGAGRAPGAIVYLDVWRRLETYLEDPTVLEKALEGPDTVARLRTLGQIKVQPVPLRSRPPVTCANAHDFLPKPGSGTLSTDQPDDLDPEDPCRLPDDSLYTGRENRLYRVEIHDPGDIAGIARPGDAIAFAIPIAANAAAGAVTLTLGSALSKAQADALVHAGVAKIEDDEGNSETLLVANATGTTLTLGKPLAGAFTIALHATITGGIARIKWSRNNASFGVQVTAVDATRKVLTVASLGRDQVTALRAGDLVELADDASELGPNRGHLTYLTSDPNPDTFTLQIADAIPSSFDLAKLVERHLLVRRWDGVAWAGSDFDDQGMDLGDGVRIKFEGFDLRSGDWWSIKTRRVDGSVEARNAALPDGIERHHCVLGIIGLTNRDTAPRDAVLALAQSVGFSNNAITKLESGLPDGGVDPTEEQALAAAANSGASAEALERFRAELPRIFGPQIGLLSDCRKRFPPLTELPTGGGQLSPYLVLKLLGGDGQQGRPGEVLGCPLVVGVENERGQPVQGVLVRFEAISSGVDAVGSTTAGPFQQGINIVTGPDGTDDAGIARAFLRLGDEDQCHVVRVSIIEPSPPQGDALEVYFEAHLRRQEEQPTPTFPRVIKTSWENDRPLPLADFNDGLLVAFSEVMEEATGSLDTFIVTIEIPDALTGREGNPLWIGHRPFIVYGGVRREPDSWVFRPCPELRPELLNSWIEQEVRMMEETRECITDITGNDVNFDERRIRVRVTLKGDKILSKEQQTPLDGNVFGQLDGNGEITDFVLDSGDGVRGGDFDSWFYLEAEG